jgi:putative transcriptional regulator
MRSLVLLLLAATLLTAQSRRTEDLRPGVFLVAERGLGDPGFARTVILLVQFDKSGGLGLVINRQSRIPVSSVIASAPADGNFVFLGGPVMPTGLYGLVRSPEKLKDALHAFGDVYMVGAKAQFTRGNPGGDLRVYAGYSGWSPGQLENETGRGNWYIFPAEAAAIFEEEPGSIWKRFTERSERNFALGGAAAPAVPMLLARALASEFPLAARHPSASLPFQFLSAYKPQTR